MLVMPANATGWFWHCLSRETGRIGHLYSPGAQRGPWPWFPYGLDCGAYACWDQATNTFDGVKWGETYPKWQSLLYWAASATLRPRWGIVPDEPGSRSATLVKYDAYVQQVVDAEIPPALAVQDGMTVQDVKNLRIKPQVICVGGSTEWKWETAEMWVRSFPRAHLLRCNSPTKLDWLEELGFESCDGTGWNRGDKTQTAGLENWARKKPEPRLYSLAGYTCRQPRNGQMEWAF